jgi:hypothetical protein
MAAATLYEQKIPCLHNALSGPIAQLGERIHGMDEVVGSIPTGSTNLPISSPPKA